jgi:hypothetical protein
MEIWEQFQSAAARSRDVSCKAVEQAKASKVWEGAWDTVRHNSETLVKKISAGAKELCEKYFYKPKKD